MLALVRIQIRVQGYLLKIGLKADLILLMVIFICLDRLDQLIEILKPLLFLVSPI